MNTRDTVTGMRSPAASSLLLVLPLAACAPSLATMQPAHVAPKGHVQATAALEVGIPTGTISKVVDAGKTLAEAAQSGMALTGDQQRQVSEAGVNLVASPPSFGQHFMIAYTLIDKLELNLRLAGGGWRGGARYQLLSHETGPLDFTVGIGVARSSVEIPLEKVIPILAIDDFTRTTVDLPILVGTSRNWFRAWAGPRFLYSRFSTALRLTAPGAEAELATFKGSATYIGGQGGIALGYKYVFLAFELTMTQMFGSAKAEASSVVELTSFDFSGFIIYPAFGLIGEF